MKKTNNEVTTNALNVKNADTKIAVPELDAFKAELQASIGLSPLAVGVKFETDDLVNAKSVRLLDFDWVEYTENVGEPDEKDVRFALWAVELIDENDETDTPILGYHQGGIVLNKLAEAVEQKGLYEAMKTYGIDINAHWGKTSAKKQILLVDIV